ncbi:MAG: undecaprenyl-diphosphate phosphatase [Patescibacteria group bacterium]|nr:MAG: undecaprenyl-diphosphate phosphatase [Patescibacteria group bacterium]
MPIYQAVVLGIIQGVTEIFPISSSGHLILFPAILGWEPHSLAFDASLHLGTAFALLAYFAKAWIGLLTSRSYKLIGYILLSSVPVGLIGLWGADYIEKNFRSPQLVSLTLVGVAVLMILAEFVYRRFKTHKGQAGLIDVLAIGFAQTLALVPGVSRSGITILAGMGRGLERSKSAYFSFMISLPIVFAAGFYQLFSVYREGLLGVQWGSFAVGIATSFIVGVLAIRFLLKILHRVSLLPFAAYRIVLGLLILFSRF